MQIPRVASLFRDANPGLSRLALSERGHLVCKNINFALSGQLIFINNSKNKIKKMGHKKMGHALF